MTHEDTGHPILLVDGGDDGMDEQGWLEKTVSAERALELMAPMNPDPELCVITIDGTEFLHPDDPDLPEDQQRWVRCAGNADGAREFWRFWALDRSDADAPIKAALNGELLTSERPTDGASA